MQHRSGFVVERIAAAIGFPVSVIAALQMMAWWPIIVFVLFVTTASILRFLFVPMVTVDTERAKQYHWFAFCCLLMLFAWLVYEAFR